MKPLFRSAALRAVVDQVLLVAVATVVGLALVVLATDCHVETPRAGVGCSVRWGASP